MPPTTRAMAAKKTTISENPPVPEQILSACINLSDRFMGKRRKLGLEDMSRKGVKRNQSSADEDIVSDLPRDVIACILGKMPIRDAVRTSVLSKQWRFNYLNSAELVFDDQFCKELDDFFVKKRSDISKPNYCLFDEIVTKSLLLHPGGLVKFKVCIPYPPSTVTRDVNKWILYLSWSRIKKLTLTYHKYTTACHKLPPYFFSCLDLTALKLQRFVLLPPPEFKGFQNLNLLILVGVDFANNCSHYFLSSCSHLTWLIVDKCSGIDHFIVSGSKLRRLSIKANDKFKSISLENAPNLSVVSVFLEEVIAGLEGSPVSDLAMFVGSLPKVKILRLNGEFLQLLAATPVSPMVTVSAHSLKILKLKHVNFMDFNQISAIVCLLRSAPNLQELYIGASTIKLNQEQVSGYLKLLDCTVFPLTKLHLAKLTNISSFAPEFEFIRFLLLSSPSLVKMSILEHPELKAEEALDITRKLLQFRPPSAVSIDFSKESETLVS